jgi:acetyltransferase-like isoleucine patch superfamily enzyme
VFITARAPITIGDNTIIGPYAIINSGDHRFADTATPIRRQGHALRPIVIGRDVWIGGHAVILKGIELGDGCVVGANAVVTHDVAPYTVVVGVPARPLSTRGSGTEHPEQDAGLAAHGSTADTLR